MRQITALAPSAAAPPTGRGAPEAPAAPFAAILDDHRARTAVAEGHTDKRQAGAGDPAPTVPAQGIDPMPAAEAAAAVPVVPVTPAPVALPLTLVEAAPIVPGGGAAATPAPAAGPALPSVPAPTNAQIASLAAGAPAVPASPAAADAPARALVDGELLVAPTGGAPAAAVPTATAAHDAATATASDAAAAAAADGQADPDAGAPGDRSPETQRPPASGSSADPQRPAAPAAPAQASAAPAQASGSTSAAAVPPSAAPTTAPAAAAPATPAPGASGVPLGHAVETVRLTMHAASERGITRARIALRPEELGGVEVHLRHSAEGLSARVVADGPEAAALLQQAAGELRRSLEQQGLTLVRLDVATSGDDQAADGAGAGATGHEGREGRRGNGAHGAREHDTPIAEQTIELANGTLVDILA